MSNIQGMHNSREITRLYLYVDGSLVDLSGFSPYLKDNIEEWIAELYQALGGTIDE